MTLRLFLALLFLLSGAGCSLFREYRTIPKPTGAIVAKEVQERLLGEVNNRFHRIETFRVLAAVRLTEGDVSHRLRYVVVVDKDRNARIEILAPTSAVTLQVLTVYKGEATLLFLPEKIAYQGAFDPGLLQKVIGVRGDIQELLALLTGSVADGLYSLSERNVQVYQTANPEKFVLSNDINSIAATIDTKTHALTRLQLADQFKESLSLTAIYTGTKEYDAVSVPQTILLNLYEQEASAEIIYRYVKLNTPIKPELFQLEIPQDFETKSFDALW